MAAPYRIYIRGTYTYYATSGLTANHVPTGADSPPDTIEAPPDGWLEVDVFGLDAELNTEGDVLETIDHALFHNHLVRWLLQGRTDVYIFPDDWSAWVPLQQHLARPFVFFAIETYDVALHPVSTCLAIVVETTKVHEPEHGRKFLEYKFRLRYDGEDL